MLARLIGIRPEDRRDATVAFLTLFGVMTAHAVLETTRDALFLSKLPARDLPWAYIAIAALSLGAAGVNRWLGRAVPRRIALSLTLFVGGVVTAAFHFLTASQGSAMLLALYVWTGLLATVVVVDLWLLVGQVIDFGQAKRIFSVVGAGGLAGAVAGAALAGALLLTLPARSLLLVAGGILAVTALLPLLFSQAEAPRGTSRRPPPPSLSWLGLVRGEPYLQRLLWVALASSVLVTGVDFVFKATASVDLAPDQLGPFFARYYASIGIIALLVQLFLAPRLLRLFGVNGSLLVLPTLLLTGSLGFVLVGGLGAAILLRGADGALRHSLHRTGTEILYVPLSQSVREQFKSFVEAVGQRGGQGLASIGLLLATRSGLRPPEIGLSLVLFAGLWLGGTMGIRPHYLDLFRKNLREGALETHHEVPELDLHSLEALISALSSHNDAEVRAALDILASYGKTNLVPALILYHPSADIVLRAADLISFADRPDVERLLPRMMAHEDERIRAAALRYSASKAEPALLESMSVDSSPLVRTTAVVELIRRGTVDEWRGGDVLRGIIDGGTPEERHALAFAARALPPGRYSWALVRLAFVREPGLAVEVARSMALAPDVDFVPTLVRLLGMRECRDDARAAILALKDKALAALDTALADLTLPTTVRRHLPRTVARFGTAEAAQILERRIPIETDEGVELKLLRALGRMRAVDRGLSVDRRALVEHARTTLERAVTLLFYRVVTERVSDETPGPKSAVADMLGALLTDKEASALDRVFRILTIIDPSEEFGILFVGLRSEDARLRDSGRELLSHVVSEPLRSGILAMLGDGTPQARLREAARFHDPAGHPRLEQALVRLSDPGSPRQDAVQALAAVHIECLRSMLLDTSDSVRSVASYRIAELGIGELETELRSAIVPEGGALAELTDRAVDLFDRQAAEVSRAG
ncbi:MAG TPA: hypothetical protein VF395_16610 [Polyangiaceae bacterium]